MLKRSREKDQSFTKGSDERTSEIYVCIREEKLREFRQEVKDLFKGNANTLTL